MPGYADKVCPHLLGAVPQNVALREKVDFKGRGVVPFTLGSGELDSSNHPQTSQWDMEGKDTANHGPWPGKARHHSSHQPQDKILAT
ncbi:hypothetical protein SLA2020_441680 [Shorea laevis]